MTLHSTRISTDGRRRAEHSLGGGHQREEHSDEVPGPCHVVTCGVHALPPDSDEQRVVSLSCVHGSDRALLECVVAAFERGAEEPYAAVYSHIPGEWATFTVIGWAELCVPRELAPWREQRRSGQPSQAEVEAWPAVVVDVDGAPRTFREFRWQGGAVRVCTDADLPVVVSTTGDPPRPGVGDRLTRLSVSEQEQWVADWVRRALAEE